MLRTNIELDEIVIKAKDELIGKITISDQENGFVIVDIGSLDNLKLGEVLSVYRDGEFIGKVQVEKIEERFSAAVILTPENEAEFKENDLVKRL